MQNFTQSASKLLLEYKTLIKKHFPEDGVKKLSALGLNKKLPVQDLQLYQIIVKIIEAETKEQLELKSSLRYSGISRFLDHLKTFMADFRLLKGKVLHPGQASSRAMLELIQMFSLPVSRLDEMTSGKIEASLWLLAKLGDDQQKSRIFKALETKIEQQPLYFTPLLNKYSHFLNLDHAAEAEEELDEEEEMIA